MIEEEDEEDVDVEEGEVGLEALMSEKDKDSTDETPTESKVCTWYYTVLVITDMYPF